MKNGDIVELIDNTAFYKAGTRAEVINVNHHNNSRKMEIRYEHEHYCGGDVDVVLKELFRVVIS